MFCFVRKYSHVPYIGFYKLLTPAILLCDIDLIKNVLQDIDSFNKNEINNCGKKDLLSKNPLFTYGENWKKCRKVISQAFTSNKVFTIYFLIDFVLVTFLIYEIN